MSISPFQSRGGTRRSPDSVAPDRPNDETSRKYREAGLRAGGWQAAWAAALYGTGGFSVRGGRGPRHDFSTSVTRGPALAVALAGLVERLQFPTSYDVVDVGAGDGRLIADLRMALGPETAARGRFTAVDLAPRPAGLPPEISWLTEPPNQVDGLLIAHELLDTVPCTVAELDAAGAAHEVCVDRSGREALGGVIDPADAAWLRRWWPLDRPGQRADVGRSRDETWRRLTASVTGGVAVAVDYGHLATSRPGGSTLTGWSRGRRVPPVPDGTCDLTAHVAFDSCAAPGDLLTTQHAALVALGAGDVPAPAPATPREQLLALAAGAQRRSLLDPDGLGGYLWLVHAAPGRDPGLLFEAPGGRGGRLIP